MVIYGEYLFLENFITGAIILYITQKIAGLPLKKKRLAFGAILCGAYAFIIFVRMYWAIALISKLGFASLVVFVTFGKEKINKFFKTVITFFVVSFLLGGITMAMLYAFDLQGISGNTSLYMNGITYINVTLGILISVAIIFCFVAMIKTRRQEDRVFVLTKVFMGGKDWTFNSLIDSGNFLRDPITGKPVVVISEKAIEQIIGGVSDIEKRYCVVPYKAIGIKNGIMEGYRSDCIVAGNQTIEKAVLAVYKGDFDIRNGEKYQILLHQDVLERGIVGDAN